MYLLNVNEGKYSIHGVLGIGWTHYTLSSDSSDMGEGKHTIAKGMDTLSICTWTVYRLWGEWLVSRPCVPCSLALWRVKLSLGASG